MRSQLCLAIALACMGPAAHAQLVQTLPDIDHLAAEPGAQVTRNKVGEVETVELQRAGVMIRSTRQGGKVQVTEEDRSGHGAVLCIWSIYIELRSSLDVCFQGKYPGLRVDLDGAIGAMNGFIAANSLAPLSAEAVGTAVTAHEAAAQAAAANTAPGRLPRMCDSPDLGQMAAMMARASHDDMQKTVTDLLSVPRPPVMNPCL